MKRFGAALFCLLAWQTALGPARAAEDDSAAALLKERQEVRAKAAKLSQESSKATTALQVKRSLVFEMLTAAKGPPPSAEKLDALKSRAEVLRLQLAAVERQLELAQVADPAIRAEKIKQLEAASVKVDKQFREAGAPMQKKIDALYGPLQTTDAAFAAALGKFFRDGSGAFAAAEREKVDWFANGTGQVHWYGGTGASRKQLAWCAIFLQDPDTGKFPGARIDGKYRVAGSSSGSGFAKIWLSLGSFKLSINVDKAEWGRNEAALMDLAKNLVDLKGLSALGEEQK